MNRVQRQYRYYGFSFLLLVSLLGFSNTAKAMGKTCWVDIYEFAQYLGDHARLQGPLSLPDLKDIDGKNWDSRIDSLITGPKAEVVLYENPNYKMTLNEMGKFPVLMKSLGVTDKDIAQESELIFGPNTKSHHLGEFNFHQKARSLKITCP